MSQGEVKESNSRIPAPQCSINEPLLVNNNENTSGNTSAERPQAARPQEGSRWNRCEKRHSDGRAAVQHEQAVGCWETSKQQANNKREQDPMEPHRRSALADRC